MRQLIGILAVVSLVGCSKGGGGGGGSAAGGPAVSPTPTPTPTPTSTPNNHGYTGATNMMIMQDTFSHTNYGPTGFSTPEIIDVPTGAFRLNFIEILQIVAANPTATVDLQFGNSIPDWNYGEDFYRIYTYWNTSIPGYVEVDVTKYINGTSPTVLGGFAFAYTHGNYIPLQVGRGSDGTFTVTVSPDSGATWHNIVNSISDTTFNGREVVVRGQIYNSTMGGCQYNGNALPCYVGQ